MTHDDARALLSAVADGEAARTPALDAHLAGCAGCTAYAGDLARLSDLTAALPRAVAPPSFAERVLGRVRRGRRRRWALRLAPALAVATAAAVVATNLTGPVAPFRLPEAAAAEPLLTLRSLYLERTVTSGGVTVREKVWWRAPASVRIERDGYLVVRAPGVEYDGGTIRRGLAPSITLPEPLSPTAALLGRDVGPGPVVAGVPTRAYRLTVDGNVRTAYVADGLTLGGAEVLVLGKGGEGDVTKTTQVLRVNPDVPDELFDVPAGPREDEGFADEPLDGLAIAPERLPEGFAVVRSGRGPAGEAYLLAHGSLPVLVRAGGLTREPGTEQRTVTHAGREHLATVALYAPPAVQVTTPAGVVTVSAPLPLESLAALAAGLYDLE